MILRSGAIGLTLGIGWGISARFWMRMISTDPEFSWPGTLLIVGFAGLLGIGVAMIYATKQLGRHQWLGILLLPGLLLFTGPGLLFLPAFLLGGFVWRPGDYGPGGDRLLRIGGSAALVGIPLAMWWGVRFDETTQTYATYADQAWAGLGFFVLSIGLAAGGSFMWVPGPKPASGEVRLLGTDGGVVAMAGVDDGVIGQREE